MPKTSGRAPTLVIATALLGGLASLEACATGDAAGMPTVTHDSSITDSGTDATTDASAETSPTDSDNKPDGDATPGDGSGCVGPVTLCSGVCVSLSTDTS